MSATQRKTSQEGRRAKVAELYLRAMSQEAIAKEVKSCRKTVWSDIQVIRAEWRTSRIRNFDEAVDQELSKLDLIERQAWLAWERSQKNAETKTVTKEGNSPEVMTKKTAGQVGEPRFLAIVQDCVERRCKLLGLDAASKSEVELKTGDRPLTREEMFRTILERANQVMAGRPSDN